MAYNRCIRVVYCPNPQELSTEEMRKALDILPFDGLVVMMDVTMLRKIMDTGAPRNIYKYLDFSIRLRANGQIRVNVIPKTEKFCRTYIFRAVRSWNSLPYDIRNVKNYKFHNAVKEYLLGGFGYNGPG